MLKNKGFLRLFILKYIWYRDIPSVMCCEFRTQMWKNRNIQVFWYLCGALSEWKHLDMDIHWWDGWSRPTSSRG